jgi:ribosomal protein L16/L10AE
MKGVSESVARSAMRIAAYKMPIRTQFIIKDASQLKQI